MSSDRKLTTTTTQVKRTGVLDLLTELSNRNYAFALASKYAMIPSRHERPTAGANGTHSDNASRKTMMFE